MATRTKPARADRLLESFRKVRRLSLDIVEPLSDAIEAYKAFDRHQPGWIKVELEPSAIVSS